MSISKLKTSATVSGTITATWSASGASVETVVLWRQHGAGAFTAVGLAKTVTTYTITGLAPGVTYDVRVLQDMSDQNASVVVPSPPPPAAPVEVSPPVLTIE